jgi:DNA-binding MarR family transcriptional regulator
MIDRLEEAGLLERRRDEVDRRAWNIHLTPKAGPLIGELHKVSDTLHRDALSGIGETELASTLDVLARIRANLSKSGVSAARKAS